MDGMPVHWNDSQVFMLLRDGRLREVEPESVKSFTLLTGGYRGFTPAEMRSQLVGEFGSGYEVTGLGHYLVVHPVGRRDAWAPRFEELYRSFITYFSSRGFQLQEPRYPLVAVVYPHQADFERQIRRDSFTPPGNILGYYSPTTNRINMYDVTADKKGYDWTVNADTIIHEATHQTAFNVGIHHRFGTMPQWIVEGLGTMFEARGVWNSKTFSSQTDRINRGKLDAFRKYARGRRDKNAIANLVCYDHLFKNDPEAAYCEAWALTFFLSEAEPQKFQRFVAKTAASKAFTEYTSPQRLKDFTDIFGTNLGMLDSRMQRFLQSLK